MDKKDFGCYLFCSGFLLGCVAMVFIAYDLGVILFDIAFAVVLLGFVVIVMADIHGHPEQYGRK